MTWLERITDHLHATADADAATAGWTVTRTGWGGRSYRWTAPTAAPVALPPMAPPVCAVVIDLAAHRARTTRPTAAAAGATVVTGATSGDAA